MSVTKVTKDNFEQEVLQSEKTVLVDFYAEWCGTCKMMASILEEIAEEVETVKIVKLNIAEDMVIARKYGVMGIPAYVVIKDGEVVKKASGEKSKSDMMDMIQMV